MGSRYTYFRKQVAEFFAVVSAELIDPTGAQTESVCGKKHVFEGARTVVTRCVERRVRRNDDEYRRMVIAAVAFRAVSFKIG